MSANITLQDHLTFSLGTGDSRVHDCLSKETMQSQQDQGDLGKQK